jgi:LSU ribosomal protein L19P
MNKLELIETEQIRKDLPKFNVGDNVKLTIKVMEGDKARLHPFEGVVIAKQGSGIRSAFTVRKVFYGEGIERMFPVNSPSIAKIEVLSQGKVKRSKLFYLRTKTGKASKVERQEIQQQEETKAASPAS